MNLEQKSVHRFIYKIESSVLKKANWKLKLPLNKAMKSHPDWIVALNESQCLRFIDEINKQKGINEIVRQIQRRIRAIKKLPKSPANKKEISSLYEKMYEIQFQKDYLCVIMSRKEDYDRANEGFTVDYGDGNIIEYRRFLGTNGGIKNSTIVYVNKKIYPALKKKLDNGRDPDMKLVPAKLEAYQALICSGSTPLPMPKGFIVVHDCITHFREDVITIDDSEPGEPVLQEVSDYEIEHDGTDGFGLMSPDYARAVNRFLTGDENAGTIAGMNTRFAWEKGMLYCFDFVEFADKIAGSRMVQDVWGEWKNVGDADVILTESMLKLWDSYKNWDDYYNKCQENGYEFCVTKVTPNKLENVRDTNYQFLQSYEFSDEEIKGICRQTIDEIKDTIGLDYRKSLAFLSGFGLNEKNAFKRNSDVVSDDMAVKALMVEPRIIEDPYIRKKIYYRIKSRVTAGERGAIQVHANYQMIGGDLYALAQNMFGLEVTGILKAREIYSKYWIDSGADEVACFRAPMTCHNNIRRMKLCRSDEAAHWFQYVDTALLYNVWDSSCEAMNGADFDGDTNMITDDPIIVKETRNERTIICVQKKADKVVPSEEDIIQANKLAFNDDIGTITNRITSMFEIQAGFDEDSEEYKTLDYRIKCGQQLQQNSIDRAKGIISKPMPAEWYSLRDCKIIEDDTVEDKLRKEFNKKIAAFRKPYFMTYVYPKLKEENDTYVKNSESGAVRRFFGDGIDGVASLEGKENLQAIYDYYRDLQPVGCNPCIVNRIAWCFEENFNGILKKMNASTVHVGFDYEILKSGVSYSKVCYNQIYALYREYNRKMERFAAKKRTERIDSFDNYVQHNMFANWFRAQCEMICPNEKELCDIVVDICYCSENSKAFAWDMCGERIIRNLLEKKGWKITYPVLANEDAEFIFAGRKMKMEETFIDNDSIE